MLAKEGQRGIQEKVRGEGWHFVMPIIFTTELKPNIVIEELVERTLSGLPSFPMRRWNWGIPGSIFGAILWLAASGGFRLYLHFFNTYTATYASLGALMILLVWLYVTGLAFLVGGEINAEIERVVTKSSLEKNVPEPTRRAA